MWAGKQSVSCRDILLLFWKNSSKQSNEICFPLLVKFCILETWRHTEIQISLNKCKTLRFSYICIYFYLTELQQYINIILMGQFKGQRFRQNNAMLPNNVQHKCSQITFHRQILNTNLKKCIAWMHCKPLWIKVSAKFINVNVNQYK